MNHGNSFFQRNADCLKRMNLPLFVLVYVCIGYGVVFIYGTGQQTGGAFANFWLKQLVWAGIGSSLMAIITCTDYRILGRYCWLIYAATIFLLIAVLIIGTRINGAKSWLRIGGGITLQPSEFAKLGVIICISWLASRPASRFKRITELFPFIFLTAVPTIFILLQPDYGSASILIPIALGIVFVSGMKKRWLVYGLALALIASPAVYKYGLKDHQRKRLLIFLHPTKNSTNEGWNARQSLLAVGSGGLTGKGFMKGTQNILGFLPRKVAPTDFIFSVIAEETGFVGEFFFSCCL